MLWTDEVTNTYLNQFPVERNLDGDLFFWEFVIVFIWFK